MQPSTKPQKKDKNRKQSTFGKKEIDFKKPLTTLNSWTILHKNKQTNTEINENNSPHKQTYK